MPIKAGSRKRGRPAFKPSDAMRLRVSIAAGGGMRHEDIAIGLGINRDTLSKYFEAELTVGASARRMEVLAGLHKAAKRGSSGAAKAYLALEPQVTAPPLPGPAADLVREAPLGKKDQANADAVTAAKGTGWETLLPSSALQ